MKNAKAFVLVSLLSVAGLVQADACCQKTSEVVATEVVATEVVPSVNATVQAAKDKKLADDKLTADAAKESKEKAIIVAGKE